MLPLFQDFGYNMSLKIHFLDFHLNFFPHNCGRSVMSTANVFIRTLPTWDKSTRGIGPRQCWLTIVGCSSEMLPSSITSDRPKEIESLKQIKAFLT
ncbi:hypothetical protein AVEN_158542-1 [Araneus ventricosus]|uniref:Uncharacterized protein n=1 Tax=Araneus ventricosus TaxID=182803 RepID=A0A4Y2IL65_ARAVE|nr:hypothetical protein AVEN_158542-1 [Araneus ventricosus]